jgi:hypothetical protein
MTSRPKVAMLPSEWMRWVASSSLFLPGEVTAPIDLRAPRDAA